MIDPLDIFKQEADEHLLAMEEALLAFDVEQPDKDLIDQIFRGMHTIKGSSGMVGLDHLSGFTHHLENLLDAIRGGKQAFTLSSVSFFLRANDHIQDLLQDIDVSDELCAKSEELLLVLATIDDNSGAASAQSYDIEHSGASDTEQTSHSDSLNYFAIKMQPHKDTFIEGFDLLPLLREINELGSCQSFAGFSALGQTPNFMDCRYLGLSLLATSHSIDAVKDIFMFVEDDWNVAIECIAHKNIFDQLNTQLSAMDEAELVALIGANTSVSSLLDAQELEADIHASSAANKDNQQDSQDAGERKLSTIELAAQGLTRQQSTEQHAGADKAETAVSQNADARNPNNQSAELQNTAAKDSKSSSKTSSKSDDNSFIKVPTNKLDMLMSLVGELVIVKAKLDELSPVLENDQLNEISEEFGRLTHDLRDNAFDIRMLPIGTIFTRFKRVVRDISDTLGKQVDLVLSGEETELDKVVLDRLADPLIHIIRNSLDHGIESPATRKENGKTAKGKISITAGHSDGFVLIEIQDDGAGLNTQRILQKATQNGIVPEGVSLEDKDIYKLIFEPGFSTAEKITDVSGRGVGMDVVRNSINKLQGRIVVDSQQGQGTSIKIYLPMTLAIIEGLSVRVGEEHFVIPLNLVEECIETAKGQINIKDGGRQLEHRGKLISTIRLQDTFMLTSDTDAIEQTVIVKNADGLLGITVDEVVGQSQTVIKSLGQLYNKTPGFMGATIMGNGRVAMIIDIPQLANDARAVIAALH